MWGKGVPTRSVADLVQHLSHNKKRPIEDDRSKGVN